ncbi:MAG TPA: HEAT repeat domain-containing protein, partial [Blastocatellia bacterium]|nr:HEAT repeat domain-containing protein [Blastocatellia bacterium]
QEGLPRKPLGLKAGEPDWGVGILCSFLEWRLLPAHLRLDPSWPHREVWCDGVGFFSLKIPQPNFLRAQGYSWWQPTVQSGAGEMSGIGTVEPIELEMRLIHDESQPRVDYSIRLWADGLCHHITPSGVAVAPLHSEAAIQPDLSGLLAVVKDPETGNDARDIAGDIRIRSIAAAFLANFTLKVDSLFAELLNDPEPEVRRAAINGLEDCKVEASVLAPLAIKALNDSDLQARCLALKVLWRCAKENDACLSDLKLGKPAVMEMFKLEYDDYRNWGRGSSDTIDFIMSAEQILTHLGQSDTDVVDTMVEALREGKTRLRAARVLWAIGSTPEAAIPIFTAALQDENREWRVCAAFSLWRFGVDGGKAFVRLAGEIENLRASRGIEWLLSVDGIMPLKLMQAEAVVPVLTAILEERKASARVWSQAALALGQIYSRDTDKPSRLLLLSIAPTLVESLKCDDWSIKSRAIEALGAMGADAKPALPALLAIVRDPNLDHFRRRIAAAALIKIGPDADAVVSLFDWLRQENAHGFGSKAIPMINLLGDQAAQVLVKTLLTISSDAEIPLCFDSEAFELLGEIGAAALPGLIELLNSERWRYFALDAMGKVGVAAVPILLDALKSEEIEERATAAEALGQIGPAAASAIPALGAALNDGDLEVCARAAEALGRIGPASVPTLIEALKEADTFALCWITKAIGEIGVEARMAITALTELGFHTNPMVRYLAAESLSKIGE